MISIIPNFSNQNRSNYCTKTLRQNTFMCDNKTCNVSFSGHTISEICRNKNFPILIHETSFFREPDTLEFVRTYVKKMFRKEKDLSVLIGACSTGEELMSLKMLLPERTKFNGIDLGEIVIRRAKDEKFDIRNPKFKTIYDEDSVKYDDSYLAFPVDRKLTQREQKYKKKFYKNFEEDCISNSPESINSKITFRLKSSSNRNFKFQIGDILELDKSIPKESTNVITFRNALYHLLNYFKYGSRTPKTKIAQKSILEKFAQQINKALKKEGIVVFGENEPDQGTNWKLVSDVLSDNGFKPIWGRKTDIKNVWEKVNNNKIDLDDSPKPQKKSLIERFFY